MIRKKLCRDRTDWSNLINGLKKEGDKIYYGSLPDFPFIAVYEEKTSAKFISFVTQDDFLYDISTYY